MNDFFYERFWKHVLSSKLMEALKTAFSSLRPFAKMLANSIFVSVASLEKYNI
jgi:hypothetical protein